MLTVMHEAGGINEAGTVKALGKTLSVAREEVLLVLNLGDLESERDRRARRQLGEALASHVVDPQSVITRTQHSIDRVNVWLDVGAVLAILVKLREQFR